MLTVGLTSLLVPPENVNALSEALVTLGNDSERRGTMANQARASLSRFNRERIVAQWEQLFASVVHR